MPYEFKLTRKVEFAETDSAGIVHFSNYFRYMEAAEHAFCRSLGIPIVDDQGKELFGWPLVHADCDYQAPLRFEDEFEIHLLVRGKTEKTITYTFIFRKLNENPVRELARGTLTVVYVSYQPLEKRMKAMPLPQHIMAKIEVAPKELL